MKKLRQFAIFAVMPFHIPLLLVFSRETAKGWMYISAVLLALFADLLLSFRQTESLTAKRNRLREQVSAFVPYFPEKCLIIAAEFGIYRVLQPESGTEDEQVRFLVWWLFCMGTAVLSAVVTFVTGAARTVLYQDDKGT